jgi:hypothetical protein
MPYLTDLAVRFGCREDLVETFFPEENILSGLVPKSASEVSAAQGGLPTAGSPREKDAVALPDLDRALLEAAEEMSFHWPEFLLAERIKNKRSRPSHQTHGGDQNPMVMVTERSFSHDSLSRKSRSKTDL